MAVHQLNTGGVQKAFLEALDAIDYDRYDVTVYIRKKRLDLLPLINDRVSEVIVNEDHHHYHRRPRAVWLLFLRWFWRTIRKDSSKCNERLNEYLLDQQFRFEKKQYFQNRKFDIAISYIQGYTAKFLVDCIDAKRKIMFYHGSTDELHALHEELFRVFSAIYCVSQPAQKEIRRLYPAHADKIQCLENVVDAERVRTKAKEFEVPAPNDRIVLCTCGRFARVKGFDRAVEAAAMLRDAGVPFLWYFVGDGPKREALERQIEEKGLRDYIMITGMQDNPYPYIKACDIYVQPSREEAQPLSVIEAQILCRPIVSTRTAVGLALVQHGETGVLTESDPSALAAAISGLAGDAALKARIEDALGKIDHQAKQRRFREQWAALLEGK